jgi:hypothetical protein
MNQFKIVMYDTFCFKCSLKFFSIDLYLKKLKVMHTSWQAHITTVQATTSNFFHNKPDVQM